MKMLAGSAAFIHCPVGLVARMYTGSILFVVIYLFIYYFLIIIANPRTLKGNSHSLSSGISYLQTQG
jgi:hypothetical protein